MQLEFEKRADAREAKEHATHFSVFEDFKRFALSEIAENETNSRKKLVGFAGRYLKANEISAFNEALNLLKQGEFLRFCVEIVNDYHALDSEVAALLMRSALRVSFKSTSALLHYSATGWFGK